MEFRQEDIAILVLGYLKDQKCRKAYLDLLSQSVHLRKHFLRHRKGHVIVTRVQGLNLCKYLEEYCAMYNIVQEHIESTKYYEEGGKKDRPSPVHQLLYLLGSKDPESRTSTPSDHMFHDRRRIKRKLPSHNDVVDNLDVNTTPAHSLPGNSSDLNYSTSSSKGKEFDTEDEASSKEKSQEICKEIFTQTFLENTDLIEKLADNINKEVSSKATKEDNNFNSAIETIIERFAQEPVIISSIEEIIGTSPSDTVEKAEKQKPAEVVQEALDTQNTEAILSIIEVSKQKDSDQSSNQEVVSSSSVNVHIEPSTANQVDFNIQQNSIVSISNQNGITNVDNNTSVANISNQHNINNQHNMSNQHLLLNSSGNLLMLPPNMTPTSISLTTGTKPYYVIGSQPTNNVIIPQTPFKVGNVLTEQDIMTMPTIIMCDNQPSLQPIIIPSNVNLPSVQNTLQPTKIPTPSAQTLSEFVTQYNCTEVPTPAKPPPPPQLESSPPMPKAKPSSKRKKKPTQPRPPVSSQVKEEEKPVQLAHSMPTLGTPQMAPQPAQEGGSRSTPRNGTHVRQLDFSTPEKWFPPVPKSNNSMKVERVENKDLTPVKAAKSIRRTSLQFTSPHEIPTTSQAKTQTQSESKGVSKSKKKDTSWDADLRALIKPTQEEPVKRNNKRKLNTETSTDIQPAKKPKENKSFNEPLQIKISISDDQNTEKMDMLADNDKVTTSENNELHMTVDTNQSLLQISHKKSETNEGFDNLNRNLKSRIRKKCNVENPTRRPQHQEEVVLTNIKRIKSCEILEDNQNKHVLSPSKLNANKRTLVEIEPSEPSCSKTSQDAKFISPDEIKIHKNFPITKTNLIPALETPVKSDVNPIFPKTPNFNSCIIDTPFTKAVLDQLTDVDISGIPTPKFPITPNIPFTPATQSPFSNRATDYSTSSSYYQPSDNEQNKSLEQLLDECKKYDKQAESNTSVFNAEVSKTPKKQLTQDQKPKENENVTTIESISLSDKKKAFNLSIIGKKNLQLVKMFTSTVDKQSSSECSSSSSSSSSCEDSDSSYAPEDAEKEEVNTYSLRSRKSLPEEEKPTNVVDKVEEPKPKKGQFKDNLLREMEQKRQRIIAKFKNLDATTPKADQSRSHKKAEVKKKDEKKKARTPLFKPEKPLPNKSEKTSKAKKKPSITEKKPLEKPKRIVKRVSPRLSSKRPRKSTPTPKKKTKLAKAIVTDDEQIVLHLSSDTESIEPSCMVEAVLMDCSNPASLEKTDEDLKLQNEGKDKESAKESDPESETAAKLKGLLQMGIHLIPNKKHSPNISTESLDNANLTRTSEGSVKLPEKGSGILNRSIEEGELISDSENDADHRTPTKDKQNEKEKQLSDQLRRFHERSKYKPNLKKSHTSRAESSIIEACREEVSLDKEKVDLHKEEDNTIEKKEKTDLIVEREDVKPSPESEYHPVTFDVVTREQETLTIFHDYTKVTNRKLSDYNRELLNKKFSANVYIAEIDSEVEKLLTLTPFEFLLEINPSISEEKNRATKKYKPLKILQNEIIKPANQYTRPSILDHLYSPEVKKRRKSEGSSKIESTKYKPSFGSSREKERESSKIKTQFKDEKDCSSKTDREKEVKTDTEKSITGNEKQVKYEHDFKNRTEKLKHKGDKESKSRTEKEKQIKDGKDLKRRIVKEKQIKDEKDSKSRKEKEKQIKDEKDSKSRTEKEKQIKDEKDSKSRTEKEKQIKDGKDFNTRVEKQTRNEDDCKNITAIEKHKERDFQNREEKEGQIKDDFQNSMEIQKQIIDEWDSKSRTAENTRSLKPQGIKSTHLEENSLEKILNAVEDEEIEKVIRQKSVEDEIDAGSTKTENKDVEKVENMTDQRDKDVEQSDTEITKEDADKQNQNDDLMNYAIIGSVESDAEPDRRNEDRTKPKAEELLKNIDVDRFLKQLHGES